VGWIAIDPATTANGCLLHSSRKNRSQQ